MRDLSKDLKWLSNCQNSRDLSDEYIKKYYPECDTRELYNNYAPDWKYGITFVESKIAREWLDRAIEAEFILKGLE